MAPWQEDVSRVIDAANKNELTALRTIMSDPALRLMRNIYEVSYLHRRHGVRNTLDELREVSTDDDVMCADPYHATIAYAWNIDPRFRNW